MVEVEHRTGVFSSGLLYFQPFFGKFPQIRAEFPQIRLKYDEQSARRSFFAMVLVIGVVGGAALLLRATRPSPHEARGSLQTIGRRGEEGR